MRKGLLEMIDDMLLKGSKMPRFEVYRGVAGKWYWRMKANNGQIIADGAQGYIRKENALNGLRIVKSSAFQASVKIL